MPVSREHLHDKGEGGEVDSWAVIEVKHQAFEVPPHCFNDHGCSLPWDGVGMCQLHPQLPFVGGISVCPEVTPNFTEMVVFTIEIHLMD